MPQELGPRPVRRVGQVVHRPFGAPVPAARGLLLVLPQEGKTGIGVPEENRHFTTPNFGSPTALTFRLSVSDSQLTSEPSDVTVTVANNTPVCTAARAVPERIWPPNHRMVPITIAGVTDPDNDGVAITITGVTQDEPVDGLGDGDTSPDAVLQGSSVLIRAERSGQGNGRVYEVRFSADDSLGGSCTGTVRVSVPHSMKPGTVAVDDGQVYNSTIP